MTDRPSDRAIAQAFHEAAHPNTQMVSPLVRTAEVLARAREIDAAAPAGAQGAVAYRLTMRSGVSDRNDNVIGDFNDRITATVVGALLKDADCLNAPEYSRFDIDPVTHPPAASEDAVDADSVEKILHDVYMDHQDYRVTTALLRDMAEAIAKVCIVKEHSNGT